MKGEMILVTSGLYSTIQDLGRFGYSMYGVPKSGAMDQRSFVLANSLLNNDENCAVLEWMLIPPSLHFSADTVLVFTGAVCDVFLDDISVKMNSKIFVKRGQIISFKNVKNGCFGYVGILGGFKTPEVLNSKSLYTNITTTHVLIKGVKVEYEACRHPIFSNAWFKVDPFWNRSNQICVFPGIEFNILSAEQRQALLHNEFTISNQRSRMGIHLKERISNNLNSIITSPVLPGTVQLTPSGNLIILMRDCQTTGGYPRIFQLQIDAINCLAQKRTGEKIHFKMVEF